MGKIKSKLIRRTAKTLLKKGIKAEEGFEKNKKLLGNILPSKKIRNQTAGLLAKINKQEKEKQEFK
jgi:ribosomal protein S17E|tara:strand:+ start:164 stop:361 length:198 start_codon:yes stop_codon:yes gene_type:complete